MQVDNGDHDQLPGSEANNNVDWGNDDWGDPPPLKVSDTPAFGQVKIGDPAFLGDPGFYRIVARALAVGVIGAVVGIAVLSAWDKDIPEGLTAIGSAAVGGLAGVLTVRR